MQRRIPAALMRGGTSRGLFFHQNHLPSDPAVRDRVILTAYGSPDPNRRQIDGVGGAVSTTSKVALIGPAQSPDYDVEYLFGQVSIDRPIIDFKGNCGNISSAVGPFAVDEGLVNAVEPVTRVRILQKNTNKLIVAEVPVKDGRYNEAGDYAIDGVPGTGGKIILRFSDPGGSLTGKLFPTGNRKDRIPVAGFGELAVTAIDAANPVIVVAAESLGLEGTEIEEVERHAELRATLEQIRCRMAVRLGFAGSEEDATRSCQAVPKIAFASSVKPYRTANGRSIECSEIDLLVRMMSMGTLHRAFAVSAAVAAAGAAMIAGTVVHDLVSDEARQATMLRLGHPGGIIEVGAVVDRDGDRVHYREAVLGRTARRIMEGYVLVPEQPR